MKRGEYNPRIRRIWYSMINRCHNPKQSNIRTKLNYYDKGIRVCDEWRESFDAFHKWSIENGYADDLTIDRIDSDKGYDPSNCRWITHEENSRLGLEKARLNRTENCKNQDPSKVGEFRGVYEVRRVYPDSSYRIEKTGLTLHDAKLVCQQKNEESKTSCKVYRAAEMNNDSKEGDIGGGKDDPRTLARMELLLDKASSLSTKHQYYLLGFMEGISQMQEMEEE